MSYDHIAKFSDITLYVNIIKVDIIFPFFAQSHENLKASLFRISILITLVNPQSLP